MAKLSVEIFNVRHKLLSPNTGSIFICYKPLCSSCRLRSARVVPRICLSIVRGDRTGAVIFLHSLASFVWMYTVLSCGLSVNSF